MTAGLPARKRAEASSARLRSVMSSMMPTVRTGAPVRTVGIIEDITERKRAEEASARFLAGSPAVIYALRLAPGGFRASWFSENIHSLTGYTYAEVRAGNPQRWWEQGIHADDLPRVVAANQAVLDEGHAIVAVSYTHLRAHE